MTPRSCTLQIQLTRRQVMRALGYPGHKQPSPTVASRFDELWVESRYLARPVGRHMVVDAAEAEALGVERRSDRVALAVCTVGHELERRSQQASDDGRMLDALILDAVGSAAAEATASALNRVLCAEAHQQDHHLTARFSPGYRRWDIRCQKPLLGLLECERIGVELTAGMMMMPRKSVSFAARLRPGPGPAVDDENQRCQRCTLESCAYRQR